MNFGESVIKSQKDLKILRKNKNYIITKARYGPSKETKIPLRINPKLAFFVAAIIGDGHLRKSKEQITIELINKRLIILLKDFSKELFNREFNIKERIKNKKSCYYMLMDSKSIFNLLSISFKIPSGKKSHIVKVPDLIINSTKKIKSAFLLGIIFTEGGNRKRGLGLSTASENLWQGLIDLFLETGFKLKKDKWIYKKYKKEYYGLSFKKEEFNHLIAGVPEWSNGRDLGGVLSYYKNKWNL